MKNFDISKEALIIRLSISAFALKGTSETIREEAAEKHGADKASIDAGLRIFQYKDIETSKGSGVFLPGSGITHVLAIRTKAKTLWKRRTVNWEDGARRLCLTKNYPKLRAELNALANEFNDACQKWLGHYEAIKADFRARLNRLSQEIEFPELSELQGKFHFTVDLDRITNPEDIRWSGIGEADTAKIQSEVENRIQEKLAGTQTEILERIQEVLKKLQQTCSDSEKSFKKSIIGNIADLVEVLPDLNILGDARINDLIARTAELAKVDPQELRDDTTVRSQTVKAASSILADLANF